jgi:hypothetical protein
MEICFYTLIIEDLSEILNMTHQIFLGVRDVFSVSWTGSRIVPENHRRLCHRLSLNIGATDAGSQGGNRAGVLVGGFWVRFSAGALAVLET